MNINEELEKKSFRLNSKTEQQILQMYNEDLIKLNEATKIVGQLEPLVSDENGGQTNYTTDEEWMNASLGKPKPAEESLDYLLKLIVEEYNLFDRFYGAGCEHGYKPAKDCPDQNCKEALINKLLDSHFSR